MYGLGKYYCGLDLLPPSDQLQQILKLNSLENNHDRNFAKRALTFVKERNLNSLSTDRSLVLKHPSLEKLRLISKILRSVLSGLFVEQNGIKQIQMLMK